MNLKDHLKIIDYVNLNLTNLTVMYNANSDIKQSRFTEPKTNGPSGLKKVTHGK